MAGHQPHPALPVAHGGSAPRHTLSRSPDGSDGRVAVTPLGGPLRVARERSAVGTAPGRSVAARAAAGPCSAVASAGRRFAGRRSPITWTGLRRERLVHTE